MTKLADVLVRLKNLCPDFTSAEYFIFGGCYDSKAIKGDVDGLYGRMPIELQKLVRKISDAPNYDHAAMELLDAYDIEWRRDGDADAPACRREECRHYDKQLPCCGQNAVSGR